MVIDKPYSKIGFKADLEVDKMNYLMTLIWSRHVNRLSCLAKLLNRSCQAKK